MNKKYCVLSNTYFIKECIHPCNIRYAFCGNSLDHPRMNLDFDFEFTKEFFRHIRFYEVVFNDKEQPIFLTCLENNGEVLEVPNGWLSLNAYFTKINYHFSLFEQKNQWYDSIVDLFAALLKWGKEVAEQRIRESIVDSIENEEDKKQC